MDEPSRWVEAPPTSRYLEAFSRIEKRLEPAHHRLLVALHSASADVTAYDLVDQVFPDDQSATNTTVDGKIRSLGNRLVDGLHVAKPLKVHPPLPSSPDSTWATFAYCYKQGHFYYGLLPQVGEALEQLGWVRPKVPKPTPAEMAALEKERETRLQQILVRRGQGPFRDGLLAAYGRRCAVTACDAIEALEAAHIIPVSESQSQSIDPANGLLLRADIHTLFDLYLLGIEPQSLTVKLSPSLRGTSYAELDGRTIAIPDDDSLCPCPRGLAARWELFSKGPPK